MIGARAICGVLLGALSVGPPDEGTSLTLQGGGGRYQYQHTGCEHLDPHIYGVNTAQAYGSVTVRDGHLAFTAEGTFEPGHVASASPCQGCTGAPPDFGRNVLAGAGAARLGGQWAYGGFGLGLAGGSLAPDENDRPFPVVWLPSASLWAGVPDRVFVWSTLGAGPGPPGLFAGIGHLDDAFAFSAGFGADGLQNQVSQFALTADWRTHPVLQPGVDLRYHDGQNWSAAVRLTVRFSAAAGHQP